MSGLVMAAQLLLALSLLVFIHELGHYLAARAFGIKVEKFFIFFDWGGKIWSKKIGDTEYGIGLFPIGGYVKIAGMIDESMDKEQMKKPPQPWEFRSKPAWQRLIVMLGGVIMNVILGVMIFTFSHLHYNENYVDNAKVVGGIYPSEYAMQIGFEKGDIITHIDEKPVVRAEDLLSTRMFFGESVNVNRNGESIFIQLPDSLYSQVVKGNRELFGFYNFPAVVDSVTGNNARIAGLQAGDEIIGVNDRTIEAYGDLITVLKDFKGDSIDIVVLRKDRITNLHALVDTTGKIGYKPLSPDLPLVEYTFFSAMKYGWKDAFESIRANAKGLGKVFTGEEKAKDSLQGPIGIAKLFGGTWDWARFWFISGLLSMVLAFMNILPIPALDGGHVLFTLIEMVSGRKIPDKAMEVIQVIGLIIVMGLMVFVIGNDLINMIFR